MSRDYRFPERFLWGAATSAYQIEGYPLADGAGPSIWEEFSHTPGSIVGGDTGDIATDHFHRYASDVDLMSELGLTSYRFSIAWARLLPEGTGKVNAAGLAFYDKLIDTLLAKNIAPMVTLYHWDLPQALDDRGGWLNRDSAHWFSEYAHVAFRAFDDRVPKWVTLNEPWVITHEGYVAGAHAPGHRDIHEAPIVTHNLLRAHGAAVQDYRACGGKHEIGLVVNLEPKYPATNSPEDVAATERMDAYMNRQYLDPVFFGSYPEELSEIYGDGWQRDFPAADWPLIQTPFDFLGINFYSRSVVRDAPDLPLRSARVRQAASVHTEMDWEVFPDALTRVLVWIKDRYGNRPMYITENGAAFDDPPHVDGPIDDPLRVWYLREHLRSAHAAIAQGVDLRGYFAWSLLDNFEWSFGYSKRFGIVHVDFDTLERTPKSSARFYSDVIRTHGDALAGE
jgi:beta-glucosidase